MDVITDGLTKLAELLVWSYMATFILLAYFLKDLFQGIFVNTFNKDWKKVYTVLIMATIIAIPFIWLKVSPWENILLSYAVGTSCHELIFSKIELLFKPKP